MKDIFLLLVCLVCIAGGIWYISTMPPWLLAMGDPL